MRIVDLTKETAENILENMLKRSPTQYGTYEAAVNEIVTAVREKKDAAVFSYTEKFDGAKLDASTVEVTEQEIGEAEAALEAAKERERGQYESMKLRIKYMYEAGETTFLDLILQSENLGQMLNRAEYVNQITRYDRQMLEEYRRSRDQVALDVNYENGMGVSVGRLREDTVYDWKFIGLSHNTVRGAAGGAILCAELLKAQGYITAKEA